MSLLTKFFGRTASEGAAFALGVATGPVLAPEVEAIRQEAWRLNTTKALEPGPAAEIAAEDVETVDWAAAEAASHGLDGDRFAALVRAVLAAPGVPELLTLRRRGQITDAQLEHGLRKARLEPQWDDGIRELLNVLLAPAELALARQQGFIDQERQHAEAALQGIDAERAELQFEVVGLPPGVETALEMLRRGVIDEATFAQIVREGHTKTKYTGQLEALKARVLSASTYATLFLKGWITKAERDAGGALTGYDSAAMDQMFLSMGRPAAPGQMWAALARGIDGPDGRPMDEAQFLKGIKESDIRPEWGPMLYGLRYTYPPLFQIGRLVASGDITPAQAVEWATKDRYAPEVVAALKASWERGGATTAKGLTVSDLTTEYEALTMTKAQYVNGLKELGYSDAAAEGKVAVSDAKRQRLARNQLVNRARVRYTGWHVSKQQASDALRAASLTINLANELLTSWDVEKELNVHTLTEAQVVKAYKKGLMDRATATERLGELGLADADVATRLDE